LFLTCSYFITKNSEKILFFQIVKYRKFIEGFWVRVYVNKHEAKCSLQIAGALAAILHTLLTANIYSEIKNLRLCYFAEAGIVLKF